MRKRITLLVVASVLAALAGMGAVSYLGVQRGINASLQGRLALAQVIAGSVDASLMNSVSMLQSLPARAFTGGDEDRPLAMELLERAYRFSIFGGGVCVYSPQGSLIAEIPPGAWAGVDITAMPEMARAMEGKGPIVSNLRPFGAEGRMGALVAAPIFDGAGVFAAVAAGRIDPDSGAFAKILQPAAGPAEARLEIIDQNGVIIFSSDKKRILAIGDHNQYIAGLIASGKPAVDECHSCHSSAGDGGSRIDETLVFTPLSAAPWGLAVIEPRDSVYSPAIGMRNAFVAMGLILVAVSALLALGLSESIVKPIHALIAATQLLARERLTEPIRLEHGGEIGALAQSFETMRARLAEAMAEVRQYGVELERRVMDRTREL
ncbi:MAG: HAMP domain-containing protein, partial [Nitrospinota bacterium]|nr:HAMP domain-containing protein [Nitrospinota bacterium]